MKEDPIKSDRIHYFLLNTNVQAGDEDERDMLEHHKAAAYFAPFKYKIEKIAAGDIVFLYRSKTGIIAVGKAVGNTQKKDYRNDPKYKDEEYFKKLTDFQILKAPVTAKMIKELAGKNMVFIQTLIQLSSDLGEKLLRGMREER